MVAVRSHAGIPTTTNSTSATPTTTIRLRFCPYMRLGPLSTPSFPFARTFASCSMAAASSPARQSVAELVAAGKLTAGQPTSPPLLRHPDHLYVVRGDITKLPVDAIVNAANERMLGGGGVDGAIHRAAGPALLQECRKVQPDATGARCPTGEARVTPAGNLPSRFVVHTVGPVYSASQPERMRQLLSNAYRNSLAAAAQAGATSIAFPSISTGAFDVPLSGFCPQAAS